MKPTRRTSEEVTKAILRECQQPTIMYQIMLRARVNSTAILSREKMGKIEVVNKKYGVAGARKAHPVKYYQASDKIVRIRYGELTDNMAKVAAKWWADQLRGNAKLDNGDPSETGAMTCMMASVLQSRSATKRTPEDIDRFEETLYRKLLETTHFTIGVDYNPCGTLVDAAKEAGCYLGMSCLPWKTDMFFRTDDSIQVSLGYGAPRETILEGRK